MKIAVFSDSVQRLEKMYTILNRIEGIHKIYNFKTLDSCLEEAVYDKNFDYIILDTEHDNVQMQMEFIQKIYEKKPLTKIILVIEDGRKVIEPIFLIPSNIVGVYQKPIIEPRFENIVTRIIERNSPYRKKKSLVFKKGGEIYSIPLEKISYIESRGHKIIVHTDEENYCYYGKLESIRENISQTFLQCHKSYLVNMDKIINMDRNFVVLSMGQKIPVSQAKYKDAKKTYSVYYGSRESRFIEARGGVKLQFQKNRSVIQVCNITGISIPVMETSLFFVSQKIQSLRVVFEDSMNYVEKRVNFVRFKRK